MQTKTAQDKIIVTAQEKAILLLADLCNEQMFFLRHDQQATEDGAGRLTFYNQMVMAVVDQVLEGTPTPLTVVLEIETPTPSFVNANFIAFMEERDILWDGKNMSYCLEEDFANG